MATKKYKIGEFAKNLGVTPDLLKHYETFGLVKPTISNDAGYRFYSFPQSGLLLQCLRMRNLGFTLKEIEEVIHDYSFDKIEELLETKYAELSRYEKELHIKLSFLDDAREWYKNATSDSIHYEFKNVAPFYYYEHTSEHDFIEDEPTRELTKSWIQWLPIVKSTYVFDTNDPTFKTYHLGLSLECSQAEEIGLLMNEKVRRIDLGFCLVNHYVGEDPRDVHKLETWSYDRLKDSLDIIKAHNFEINGPIYQLNYTTNRDSYPIAYTTIIPIK